MVSQPVVTVTPRKGGPNSQVLLLGVIAAGILIHRLGTWGLLDASALLPAGLAGDYWILYYNTGRKSRCACIAAVMTEAVSVTDV